MLQGLDLGANFSNLPDRRKKLIPYNPKVKMHKAGTDACPKVATVQTLILPIPGRHSVKRIGAGKIADCPQRRQGLLECARSTSPNP